MTLEVATPSPVNHHHALSALHSGGFTEFERRYRALPQLIKAELIEGIGYLLTLPNTSFKICVTRAAGFLRIFFSSSPT